MTLTATNRGQGGNNIAATSFTGVIPATDYVLGSLGVLLITTDNAGANGDTPVCPTSFADSKGNTWTRSVSGIYDPGAAAAGVEIGIYTADIWTPLLTTDNANFAWAAGVSVTAKNWAFVELTSTIGRPIVLPGAVNVGSATASPTVTTTSIPTGNVVIAVGGSESGDTWVTDGDTTNGSWTTFRHRASGTGLTGMTQIEQHKTVIAAGTQTYNPTLTSADVLLGWIEIGEALIPHPDINYRQILPQ